jgi:hypothetical protein
MEIYPVSELLGPIRMVYPWQTRTVTESAVDGDGSDDPDGDSSGPLPHSSYSVGP